MTKFDKSHLSLAGEYRVASELLKRGLNATVTFGHAKSVDVVAYGSNRKAVVNDMFEEGLTKSLYHLGVLLRWLLT